jgi:hypothetical protein
VLCNLLADAKINQEKHSNRSKLLIDLHVVRFSNVALLFVKDRWNGSTGCNDSDDAQRPARVYTLSEWAEASTPVVPLNRKGSFAVHILNGDRCDTGEISMLIQHLTKLGLILMVGLAACAPRLFLRGRASKE